MNRVHILDGMKTLQKQAMVEVLGCSHHEIVPSINNRVLGGVQDHCPKEECTARVCIYPLCQPILGFSKIKWLEPDEKCCNAHSQGLNYIAYDMCHCSFHCHAVRFAIMTMTTPMSMRVIVG